MIKQAYKYYIDNEILNNNPLVLCYRVFIPVKYKTDIKGLWLDKNRVYHDNIKIDTIGAIHGDLLKSKINHLIKYDNQLAVFYKDYFNNGIIQDKQGDKIKLDKQKIYFVKRLKKSFIKNLLKKYGGLTIYKQEKTFIIEVYYK